MDEQDEVEFEMNANDDATVVTLTLRSTVTMSVGDLILALETYLSDLTRAEADKRRPGVLTH